MYDYSARYMEPAIGRFTSVDPMAEKFYSWSPYAYCLNNPLKFTDPDGKIPIIPVLVGFGVKFIVGAIIDGAAQTSVSMAQGSTFGDAVRNIDTTQVVASGAISTVLATGAKVALVVTAVAMDASFDSTIKMVQHQFLMDQNQLEMLCKTLRFQLRH